MTTTTAPATRKIAVNLTVEVDAETWALIYGTGGRELRTSVKAYLADLVIQSAAGQDGAILTATVR